MARPTLQRPSKDPAVLELQDLLNRDGALVDLDGDFGPGTEAAVKEAQAKTGLQVTGIVDTETWNRLEAQRQPSPDIPTEAVTFIVQEEVGSRSFYERHTAMPHFPGEASGVTIGIGYDLRFQEVDDFERDWSDVLTEEQMTLLRPHLRQKGSEMAIADLDTLRIPFTSAWQVFCTAALPRTVSSTRRAFDGFDALPPLCRGVLVSLTYNRGTAMNGERRREMKDIRGLIKAGALGNVSQELRSMKRLWPNSKGLRDRRDKEANMWEKGLAEVDPSGV